MDDGVRALIEMRRSREAAADALDAAKAAKRKRRRLIRVLCALALVLASYWIGYERGLASALFH